MLNAPESMDGALLVDKPAGMTSHDVVDRLRRHLGIKKVGHCGTLDPAATGLLIIVLGRGTKLSELLMASDKVYGGRMKFGEETSTYDAEGELVASLPVPPMSLEELNELASGFVGDTMQTPPMVSAVKIKGVPLYKLARKGAGGGTGGPVDPRVQLPVHLVCGAVRRVSPRLHEGNLCPVDCT
jgi:tRNA pseudouridine55 synthase